MTGVVGSLDIHIHISSRGTRVFPCFHCALLANDIQIMAMCAILELDQGGISLVLSQCSGYPRISTRSIAIFVLVSWSMEY
jgi:hypothetical protein